MKKRDASRLTAFIHRNLMGVEEREREREKKKKKKKKKKQARKQKKET